MNTQIKGFFSFTFDVLKIVVIALAIVVPIRYFLFQPFVVKGASMEPNYHSGDYLIIDEISYRFNEPQRGDVIVFKYPLNQKERYIKRIIGLPGETVEIKDGQIFINGQTAALDEMPYLSEDFIKTWKNLTNMPARQLSSDQYFVLGDNRNYSSDSRGWGNVPEENIIGRASIQFSLPSFLNFLGAPLY